jgi:peptide/nickel transport system permease protein
MWRTIGQRVLGAIPALLGVVVVSFLINRVIPGDPARAVVGDQATPAVLARARAEMGLDQPLWKQFIDYLVNLSRFDFGTAWHTGRPVLTDLMLRLPATIELALAAAILALLLAIPAGVFSAVFRGKPLDYVIRVLALIGASIPIFWLGLELIQLFYVVLGIAPAPSGRVGNDIAPPTHLTGLYVLDSLLSGDGVALGQALSHLMLPAICLATGTLAVVSRMTRSSMLEVLERDYIRTAWAKGLPAHMVIGKHALKNAAPPVLTVVGLQLGFLLSGAVITETIFDWPGIGSYIYEAISANDYAPIQAVMLLSATIFIVINLVVDIVQILIDPKVRIV